jgi:hypothetical protein
MNGKVGEVSKMVNRKRRLEILRWIVWKDMLFIKGGSSREEWKRGRLEWMRRGLLWEVISYVEFINMYEECEKM